MNIGSGVGDDHILKRRKKRKVTLTSSSPNPNRLWSKDDEIVILKGIIDYRNKTGVEYYSDLTAFFDHIKSAIDAKVSKDQLVSKIGKLKAKFKNNSRKNRRFINSHDYAKFDMCKQYGAEIKLNMLVATLMKPRGARAKFRLLWSMKKWQTVNSRTMMKQQHVTLLTNYLLKTLTNLWRMGRR